MRSYFFGNVRLNSSAVQKLLARRIVAVNLVRRHHEVLQP